MVYGDDIAARASEYAGDSSLQRESTWFTTVAESCPSDRDSERWVILPPNFTRTVDVDPSGSSENRTIRLHSGMKLRMFCKVTQDGRRVVAFKRKVSGGWVQVERVELGRLVVVRVATDITPPENQFGDMRTEVVSSRLRSPSAHWG
jgi:hypothetical protein